MLSDAMLVALARPIDENQIQAQTPALTLALALNAALARRPRSPCEALEKPPRMLKKQCFV